jgi:hypothetical protein
VRFVVCFGYIQSLKEECTLFFQSLYVNKTYNKTRSSFRLSILPKQTTKHTPLSVSVYDQSKQQSSLFLQTLDITKTNNKTRCLFWLYTETERGVCFVVCFGYIQSLKEE